MKKILINTPDKTNKGGVIQYYKVMDLDEDESIDYFSINNDRGILFFRIIKIYLQYVKKIKHYETVVLNPSLEIKSFLRDGIFAYLAKSRNKRLIIFWHGWRESFEIKLRKSTYLKFFFDKTFLKADGIIILGEIFRNKLVEMGYSSNLPFYKERMSISREWIENFSIEDKLKNKRKTFNIFFLSRIVKGKGVNICIDLACEIATLFPSCPVEIHIAGDGEELVKMKKYAIAVGASNVFFHGDVRGEKKYNLFFNMDVFFFPSETEGFPNAVIEALFFGLPVITRPVGALPEIIEHGKNGFLDHSNKAVDFIKYIEPFINEKAKLLDVARVCHEESKIKYNLNTVKERTKDFYKNF
jgi:glycosyltransferase involved in cell wall biosynthesis